MRIIKEQSLGLIIDVQERLFPHMHHQGEALIRKTSILIRGLQLLDIPVVYTEQYPKGLGPTIAPVKELFSGTPLIEKMTFSCCGEPSFMKILAEKEKKFVIVAGIESHVCVLQTAIDLKEAGYQPVVITDAVSSRHMEDKETALRRMTQENILLSSCESVLFELARVSGTDPFKAISQLVK